jgi:cytochrome c-type biogenesis protein CcmH
MRVFALVALLASLVTPGAAFAVTPDEMLKDPALEARARDLSRELRCMVCQNQSIDDSEAPLAKDLRVLVRERLTKGDSDKQVLDFLVARYGEFVLLKPPFEWHTLVLWGAMPVALLAGMIGLIVIARRRQTGIPASMELSAAEARRIEALLDRQSSER